MCVGLVYSVCAGCVFGGVAELLWVDGGEGESDEKDREKEWIMFQRRIERRRR